MPMRRAVSKLPRPSLLVGATLCALLVSGVNRAFPLEPADPQPAPQELKAGIRDLAASMVDRLDAVKLLNKELDEREPEVEALAIEVKRAEKRHNAANVNVHTYEAETYPGLLDTARSTLAQERADVVREAARFRTLPSNSNRLVLQTAELRAEQALSRLEVLEGFTRQHEIDSRTEQVKAAKTTLQSLKDQLVSAQKVLAGLEQRAKDAALSDLESRAVVRLDEAIRLQDQGRLDQARAALEEAAQLWRSEETRRFVSRSVKERRRIGQAAQEIRKRQSTP